MEYIGFNSSHEDIAEAIKGCYGKDVLEDCSFVYFGQGIIGIGDSTEILDKHCKCKHGDWINIGNNIYFSILK